MVDMDDIHQSPNGREKEGPDRLFARLKACGLHTLYQVVPDFNAFPADFEGACDSRVVSDSG